MHSILQKPQKRLALGQKQITEGLLWWVCLHELPAAQDKGSSFIFVLGLEPVFFPWASQPIDLTLQLRELFTFYMYLGIGPDWKENKYLYLSPIKATFWEEKPDWSYHKHQGLHSAREILYLVALSKLASLPSAGRGGAATPFMFTAPSSQLCPSTLQVGPTKCQTSSCTAQGLWAVCSSPLFVPLPTHTHLGLHQLPAHCSPFPPCDLILIPPAPLQGTAPSPPRLNRPGELWTRPLLFTPATANSH